MRSAFWRGWFLGFYSYASQRRFAHAAAFRVGGVHLLGKGFAKSEKPNQPRAFEVAKSEFAISLQRAISLPLLAEPPEPHQRSLEQTRDSHFALFPGGVPRGGDLLLFAGAIL
jgi:hypothetical protein